MNKRATFVAVCLTLLGWRTLGQDTGYSVKVTDVDKAQGVVVARFVIVPQDLRIVCRGDVSKVFADDYVKVVNHDGVFKIGGATCNEVRWLR